MKRWALTALLLGGCAELPEVSIHRDGFDLAVEFDHRVCEGTLHAMEERIDLVEAQSGTQLDQPMTIYWLQDRVDRICPRPVSGCFIPGTRIVAATQPSIHHEIVHAVLDTRGGNPFVEEGLAEVLSGASAYHRVHRDDDLLASLRTSPRDAWGGRLDYMQAAHFMHFVRERAGLEAVTELSTAIDHGDAPQRYVQLFERAFDEPAKAIEDAYLEAPRFYPSTLATRDNTLTEFDLLAGARVDLNCGEEDTMGPRRADRPGMFQLRRIAPEESMRGTLYFEGTEGTTAELFREVDPAGEWVQQWWSPAPWADPARIELKPGEHAQVELEAGVGWLLMVRSGSPDAPASGHVQLR